MKHLLFSVSAIALATTASAQDGGEIWLDTITVTAQKSGKEVELKRTGATVEVLEQDDIERAPETSVAESLARLPGVSASANGPLGTAGTLRIRGLDGKYVKVLIDGIDVTDPSSTQTQFNFGGLTNSNLGRLELLKGSASSIYGSRAVAGVVSIDTVSAPDEPGTTYGGSVEGGSFGTWRGAASIGHRGDRGGISFSWNRVITDGYSARQAGTEEDGYQATQLNLKGDFQATDYLTFGFSALALDAEGQFDEFGGDGTPPFDEFNTTKTRALRGWAELDLGAFTHTVSASYYENDRVSSSNGFDTPALGERRRIDYVGTYDASDILSFTFGADWERESFTSGANAGEADTAGLFGEVLYAPSSNLDLSGSLRVDDHENFGTHVTGRLAGAYRFTDNTILRAVAATGFRAPSLYELHHASYGNSALLPEESTSFELGVEHHFGSAGMVKATAFYTEIDNLIQFVTLTSFPAPFTGQYRQVAGTSVSKGIELSADYAISDSVTLYGNYTYTDAKDAKDAPLLRVPEHDALVGISFDLAGAWTGDLNARWVGGRPAEFGTEMPDYTVVNAGLGYAINDNAQAYIRVENLFDEDYQTSAGYSASGRAIYAGLRAQF